MCVSFLLQKSSKKNWYIYSELIHFVSSNTYELGTTAIKYRKGKEVVFCISRACLQKSSSLLQFSLPSIDVYSQQVGTAGSSACLTAGGQPSLPSHWRFSGMRNKDFEIPPTFLGGWIKICDARADERVRCRNATATSQSANATSSGQMEAGPIYFLWELTWWLFAGEKFIYTVPGSS